MQQATAGAASQAGLARLIVGTGGAAAAPVRAAAMPADRWTKCPSCGAFVYYKRLEKNLKVCPECNYHFRLSARERITFLLDPGSFVERGHDLTPGDPLGFVDSKPYPARIAEYRRKTGSREAAIYGTGTIGGRAIVICALWMYVGFNMIYFLAALQNVDQNLIDAARIDGAGTGNVFRHVTLPAIAPVTTFVVVTSTIGSFQLFELPYTLLEQNFGPKNSGLTIVGYLWNQGPNTGDFGMGAAVGATCSKKPHHSSKLITSSVCFQFALCVTAVYTWLRNASPLRMSENGWSSLDVPLSSSMNRGSANETSGSVPAAQSSRKVSNLWLIDAYLGPHNARNGASLK